MKRTLIVPLVAAAAAALFVVALAAAQQQSKSTPPPAAQTDTIPNQLNGKDISLAASEVKQQLGGKIGGAQAQALISIYNQYMDQYASDVTPVTNQGLYASEVLVISITGDLSGVGFSHPAGSSVTPGHSMLIVLDRTTGRVLSRTIEAAPTTSAPKQQSTSTLDLSQLDGTPEEIPVT